MKQGAHSTPMKKMLMVSHTYCCKRPTPTLKAGACLRCTSGDTGENHHNNMRGTPSSGCRDAYCGRTIQLKPSPSSSIMAATKMKGCQLYCMAQVPLHLANLKYSALFHTPPDTTARDRKYTCFSVRAGRSFAEDLNSKWMMFAFEGTSWTIRNMSQRSTQQELSGQCARGGSSSRGVAAAANQYNGDRPWM